MELELKYNFFQNGNNTGSVKLMLRILEFAAILFDCITCRQNVTCLKCLPGMGIMQMRWKMHNHRQTRSCLLNRCVKN